MAVSVGQLIQASQYNALADICNRLFADSYPTSEYMAQFTGNVVTNAAECNSIFAIHETDYPTTSPGTGPFTLSPAPSSTDYIVVQVGDEVKVGVGFSIDYTAETITFTTPLPAATRVVVYNRSTHLYGYGNSAIVNNLAPTDIVEAVYVNSIIDRTNIMFEHVGDTTRYNTVPIGQLVSASGFNNLETSIYNQLYTDGKHLTVDAASVVNGPTMTRAVTWTNKLEGIFSYTFTNYSQARYFFNSGGEIRWSLDFTGSDTNPGYVAWDIIARKLGTVRMNHSNVSQSGNGGTSNGKGFYRLTDDWQLIFTAAGVGGTGYGYGYGYGYDTSYAGIGAEFYAKYVSVGGNHQIQIKVILDDSNSDYGSPVVGTSNFVTSLLQPDNLTQNSVNYSVVGPTIATVEDFNSGNDS